MRILHLTTSLTNGAGKAARRINSSINRAGGDSYLVTTGRVDGLTSLSEERLQPSITELLSSKTLTLFQRNTIQKSELPITSLSIQTVNLDDLELELFDVVNVHATYNLLSAQSLIDLSKFAKQLVFTLHDERLYTGGCHNTMGCNQYLTACRNCPQATKIGKIVVRSAFRTELSTLSLIEKPISIVAPSDWIREKASQSLKFQNYPIKKISNPIPESIYSNGHREFNRFSDSSKITLGFIAAQIQSPFKGFQTLLAALRLMSSEELRKYRLLVVGNTIENFSNSQIEVIQHQSNDDHVMAELLRAIDLLVVPSKGDNSPSVISESLMCGTKVIGSGRGGIPEMLEFDADLIFDPESPADLVRAIRKNSVKYNRNIIEIRAHEKYSSTWIGREYLNYYKDLISEPTSD